MTTEFGNKVILMTLRMCRKLGIHNNYWDDCVSVALEQVWKMLKTKSVVKQALIWNRIKFACLQACRDGSGGRLSETTKKIRHAEMLDEWEHEEFIIHYQTPLAILIKGEQEEEYRKYLKEIEDRIENKTEKEVFRLLVAGKKSVEASRIIGISEGRVSQCRSKILREVVNFHEREKA